MLPKKYRLSKKDIPQIFKQGKRFKGKSLALIVSEDSEEKRIGVIIAKKTFNLAVDRNKAKRRIRSIIKENMKSIPGKKVLIYATPGIRKMGYDEIKKDLIHIFQKLSKKD